MMLSLDTAYRSFGGEVEASSTPTICRLPDSRRHQIWAIALSPTGSNVDNFKFARACQWRAQLIPEPHQAGCFIGPRAVRRPFKARVNQFEVEDGNPQAACMRR